jgi:hypothetical protein
MSCHGFFHVRHKELGRLLITDCTVAINFSTLTYLGDRHREESARYHKKMEAKMGVVPPQSAEATDRQVLLLLKSSGPCLGPQVMNAGERPGIPASKLHLSPLL